MELKKQFRAMNGYLYTCWEQGQLHPCLDIFLQEECLFRPMCNWMYDLHSLIGGAFEYP